MTVQQLQEMIVELSVAERQQIARWLNELALPNDEVASSAPEKDAPTEEKVNAHDAPQNGSTQSGQIGENNPAGASSLPENGVVGREKQAYKFMHRRLWSQYPEQHVAIYGGQLVDHDVDGIALSRRIYAQYPEDFVLIKKVEPQPERTLHFRSPRFIREESAGS